MVRDATPRATRKKSPTKSTPLDGSSYNSHVVVVLCACTITTAIYATILNGLDFDEPRALFGFIGSGLRKYTVRPPNPQYSAVCVLDGKSKEG